MTLLTLLATPLTEFATAEMEPDRLDTVPVTEPDEPVIAVRMSQVDGHGGGVGAEVEQPHDCTSNVTSRKPLVPGPVWKNELPVKSTPPTITDEMFCDEHPPNALSHTGCDNWNGRPISNVTRLPQPVVKALLESVMLEMPEIAVAPQHVAPVAAVSEVAGLNAETDCPEAPENEYGTLHANVGGVLFDDVSKNGGKVNAALLSVNEPVDVIKLITCCSITPTVDVVGVTSKSSTV